MIGEGVRAGRPGWGMQPLPLAPDKYKSGPTSLAIGRVACFDGRSGLTRVRMKTILPRVHSDLSGHPGLDALHPAQGGLGLADGPYVLERLRPDGVHRLELGYHLASAHHLLQQHRRPPGRGSSVEGYGVLESLRPEHDLASAEASPLRSKVPRPVFLYLHYLRAEIDHGR